MPHSPASALASAAAPAAPDRLGAWRERLRSEELEAVLARLALPADARVLEVGAGEGIQARALLRRFPRAVSMDVADQLRGADVRESGRFAVASALQLPFADGSFHGVLSSNVLEHLPDVDVALREMRRVLRPGGVMAHTVPNRLWKSLYVGLYPVSRVRSVPRWLRRGRGASAAAARPVGGFVDNFDAAGRPVRRARRFAALIPAVHGASATHREEWRAFGQVAWLRRFRDAGFRVEAVLPLLFYTPHRFLPGRGLALRGALGAAGLSVTTTFVLSRGDAADGRGDR